MVRNSVRGDTLGVGREITLPCPPVGASESVDKLTFLTREFDTREVYGFTHISLSGSRWPHNTILQDHFSTVTTTLNYNTHTMIKSFGSALKLFLDMLLADLSIVDAIEWGRWSRASRLQIL